MPVAVHHIMTAALNGKIYVFGGFVSRPNVVAWKPTDHASCLRSGERRMAGPRLAAHTARRRLGC
jgi:hypothetical protein